METTETCLQKGFRRIKLTTSHHRIFIVIVLASNLNYNIKDNQVHYIGVQHT